MSRIVAHSAFDGQPWTLPTKPVRPRAAAQQPARLQGTRQIVGAARRDALTRSNRKRIAPDGAPTVHEVISRNAASGDALAQDQTENASRRTALLTAMRPESCKSPGRVPGICPCCLSGCLSGWQSGSAACPESFSLQTWRKRIVTTGFPLVGRRNVHENLQEFAGARHDARTGCVRWHGEQGPDGADAGRDCVGTTPAKTLSRPRSERVQRALGHDFPA